MTYTKRQFFIYRIGQCLNLLSKVNDYLVDVYEYVKTSKYKKEINKLMKNTLDCSDKLNRFLVKVLK